MKLSKADVRRALIRHHFAPCATAMEAFERLRSIQFDPIAPVGCNHDLVLQARVPGYRVGDWERFAYQDRLIYDGWDKMASLVPYTGWPVRRVIYTIHRQHWEKKIFEDHADAVEAVLREITERGPMLPKDFEFQQRREDWKGSWYGAGVTKQTLRALWSAGLVMTSGRKRGQHLYDLTERVVPPQYYNEPKIPDDEALLELMLDRHRAMGIIRPAAAPEVWSYTIMFYVKRQLMAGLVERNQLVPVEVEGQKTHATHDFLGLLDKPSLEPRVIFVAPLDQLMWDRKMIAHLFGFDYIWEIYTPLAKRRWGYYVLPVLFGDRFVARAEFFCRDGLLELREWHFEQESPDASFWPALEHASREFMKYCSASRVSVSDGIDAKVREVFQTAAGDK